MELIKILILGTVACICMHSATFFLFKNNPPIYLIKFKWVISILLILIFFLIEDYSELLKPDNINILFVINLFIAYSFISGLRKINK